MSEYTLWFTRKNGEVKGPFPAKVISQYLLLGRLLEDDEASADKLIWKRIGDIEALVPAVMREDLCDDPEEYARALEMARRNADERIAGDRRGEDAFDSNQERRGRDRRNVEPEGVVKHRQLKTAILKEAHQDALSQRNNVGAIIVVILFVCVLIGVAVMYTPESKDSDMNCSAAPASGVNWSNCNLQGVTLNGANLKQASIRNANLSSSRLRGASLEGADLAFTNMSLSDLRQVDMRGVQAMGASFQGSNLTGADLNNADLSYADLWGAVLENANLQGVKLDHAVWVDKRVCAVGSFGECR
ncbi:pentapeptide repeat-containing protein [Pseudomonadota bacterium]